ncbi:hypothetical protein JCM11641_007737 [Rhodosporidiobolus odoratus]
MATTAKSAADVELVPLQKNDSLWVAEGCFQAFPTFYEPMFSPPSARPSHSILVKRFSHRLSSLLDHRDILATKAVVASGSEQGRPVGIALWHRPGAPIRNLKRRVSQPDQEESLEDKDAWEGTDSDKWEQVWGGWDKVRSRIMGDVPHWYIAPLWIIPENQGQGVGSRLLQQVIDLADAHTPPQPIYLEASADGKRLYEKLGFVVEGGSEYVEMVRWNKEGRKRGE